MIGGDYMEVERREDKLEHLLFHKDEIEKEREKSDKNYAGKWLEKDVADTKLEAPKKFADKWTEKLLTGMLVTILLAVLGVILRLVMVK